MNRIVLISTLLILVSENLMAQSNSDAARSDEAQAQTETRTESQAKAGAEPDQAREAQRRKAQMQSRQAVGEAARPEWPQAESDAEPDDPEADSSVRKSGAGGSSAADKIDHGNPTSSEMLQRRDQSKAIKQEYRDSGTKQKGKKPWHKSNLDDADSDGDTPGDDGAVTTGPVDEPDQARGKKNRPQSRPDRNDDDDHD
jgi:hypothetical protein